MDRVIRIKCRQNLVNYRKPASHSIKETYPLPPYSTIIGMLHKACSFENYHALDISVQGSSNCTVADLYTRYAFADAQSYEVGRHQLAVSSGDKTYGISRAVKNVELICQIDLVIHIMPKNPGDFSAIEQGLLYPHDYLALGRHEDLLDIYEIKQVVTKPAYEADTQHDIYVPLALLVEEGEQGTVYDLNKEFAIDEKTKLRYWKQRVKVKHICAGTSLYDIKTDEDGYVVALA